MCGSTSRRSASARACAMARVPAGRISDITLASSLARSSGIASEDNAEYEVGSKAFGPSSAARSANCRRRSTWSGGSDPAQPVWPPNRTRLRTRSGRCRYNSNASVDPHECPSTELATAFVHRAGSSEGQVFDDEELPLAGDAFERMGAAISERDARTRNQVGDGARDEHLVWMRERLHPLCDVDGDAADVVTAQLDLARVEPIAHMDADRADRVADGSPRPVEDRQEAVAGRFDLPAAEAVELGAREAFVGAEEL